MFRSAWGSVANLNNVLLQSDGKIVGVGMVSGITNSYYEIGVVRIVPSGGGPSSITEKISDKTFLVYPNPTKDVVKIKTQVQGFLKVTNQTGKVVLQLDSLFEDQIHHLDIANLSPGIYYVAVVTNQGVYQQKFIKQ